LCFVLICRQRDGTSVRAIGALFDFVFLDDGFFTRAVSLFSSVPSHLSSVLVVIFSKTDSLAIDSNCSKQKKADVVEYPWVLHHVGLLIAKPPAKPGCPSFSHPTS
jgi:hypothetical protein